jgi:hypothetical protein
VSLMYNNNDLLLIKFDFCADELFFLISKLLSLTILIDRTCWIKSGSQPFRTWNVGDRTGRSTCLILSSAQESQKVCAVALGYSIFNQSSFTAWTLFKSFYTLAPELLINPSVLLYQIQEGWIRVTVIQEGRFLPAIRSNWLASSRGAKIAASWILLFPQIIFAFREKCYIVLTK